MTNAHQTIPECKVFTTSSLKHKCKCLKLHRVPLSCIFILSACLVEKLRNVKIDMVHLRG